MGEEWSEVEELGEVERREQEIVSGQVHPLSDTEFWKRAEVSRQGGRNPRLKVEC